jgi:hypothetical protein
MTRHLLCVSAALAIACGSSSGGVGEPAAQAGSGATAGTSATARGGSVAAGGSGNAAGTSTVTAGTSSGGTASGGSSSSSGGMGGMAGAAAAAGAGGTKPAGDLWVAPDGNDANPGSEAQPLLNLPNALARITAGFTVWLKAGTYSYKSVIQIKKSGTMAAGYTISAAPGTRPIVNFAGSPAATRGFDLQGDYWHFLGFEVENATDNCIAISGSHNTIENMTIHACGDTGLQITVSSANVADNTRGAYNLVLNTDSYENFDAATGGENADGFAAKLRIGPGNVFRGCRAYNNSDDGWDFFAADDVVEIDGSWAFSNGKGVSGNNPAGDGNGFKLGGKPTSAGEGGAVHLVKDSFAFENLACGYTQNNNPDVPKLSNCGAKDNGKGDYCGTLSKSGSATMTMTGAQAKAVKRNADGSLPPMK